MFFLLTTAEILLSIVVSLTFTATKNQQFILFWFWTPFITSAFLLHAILDRLLLFAARRKALFEKANVIATCLQNIKLSTPVFA
jgi:hypothetical protein